VLIVPKGRPFPVKMRAGFDIARAFEGKLCTAEPEVVPAGIYAKQSLQALRWWPALEGRIVGTDDVRAALTFVERGECAAGIVYATDAAISAKVQILERFPTSSHKPIVYPFALVTEARSEAHALLEYIISSPQAAAVFTRHGFMLLRH
jgi:molybdate transport system substrate-binding protein